MTRETVRDTAAFTAMVARAFIIRNAIGLIGLTAISFFALFSV